MNFLEFLSYEAGRISLKTTFLKRVWTLFGFESADWMNGIDSKKNIPTHIIHYSRGEPFLSITSVPSDELKHLIGKLNETNAWGLSRFSDPHYLSQRIQTESQVRDAFIAKGGKPYLTQPIYFFLGNNVRFEEHKQNKAYKIELQKIPAKAISFTYGDSMLAFNEVNRKLSGIKYQNPLCAKVYLQEELESVFLSPHFPQNDPLAIEAQLWITPNVEIVTTIYPKTMR